MLATLASAAAAPPLAPPGAADAPTLDLYVGDERRTTIATNFGTATEALAAAVLRARASRPHNELMVLTFLPWHATHVSKSSV